MTFISDFPGFQHLYAFQNAFAPGAMRFALADAALDLDDIAIKGQFPKRPLEFRHDSGKRVYDLMGESSATLHLVSERLVAALKDSAATGWLVHPVVLYGKDETPIPDYWALISTGRCGPIDRRKTRIVRQDPPVPNGSPTYAELGLLFDPSSWDRSEIFSPDGTSIVCVTESVKMALERARVRNVSLKALSEYQVMLHPTYPAHRAG